MALGEQTKRPDHPLRTATDFNEFFAKPDPWAVEHNPQESLRYRLTYEAFRARIRGRDGRPVVLELGCAEGYFTGWIRDECELWVNDISPVALARVDAVNKRLGDALELANDRAFLQTFDAVLALEMLYYLSHSDRQVLMGRLAANMASGSCLIASVIVSHEAIYFRPGELERIAEAAGFDLVQRHPVTARWPRWAHRIPTRIKASLLRHSLVRGHQYLFVFRKRGPQAQ